MGRKYPAEPLRPDQVIALLRQCSKTAPTGIRNRSLIVALWRGGLRVEEALMMPVHDVDFVKETLLVRYPKGWRGWKGSNGRPDRKPTEPRTIGMDLTLSAELRCWMAARKKAGITSTKYLFSTLTGTKLSAPYVRIMLDRLAAKAGLETKVTPHRFRHSFAHDLLEEGYDVVHIQESLGHRSLATTETYLRAINPKARLAAQRKRKPVEGLSGQFLGGAV